MILSKLPDYKSISQVMICQSSMTFNPQDIEEANGPALALFENAH
jgi:hypothetical protein